MKTPVTPLVFVRFAVITLAGVALAFLAPAGGDATALVFTVAVAAIFGTVMSVLFTRASERKRRFLDAVRLELNKLRRLYHLSKNLSTMSPRFRQWFTETHGYLYGYLSLFTGKNFESYDGFNAAFRKLSYHMYTSPELETAKEGALYSDLLKTTANVAEARQQIKELWDNRFSTNTWLVALLMAGGVIVSVLASVNDAMPARAAAAAVIVAVVLVLELLWRVDALAHERKAVPARYVENMSRLELGRVEEA